MEELRKDTLCTVIDKSRDIAMSGYTFFFLKKEDVGSCIAVSEKSSHGTSSISW